MQKHMYIWTGFLVISRQWFTQGMEYCEKIPTAFDP